MAKKQEMTGRDMLRKQQEARVSQQNSSNPPSGNNRVAGRDKVKKAVGRKQKRMRFPVARMWVSTLLSFLEKDRGKIPDNIGNNVMITNNMYITKAYMSSMIHVRSLSLETPVTLCSEINEYLRRNGSTAVVDVTIKNMDYFVNLMESGMKSRIQSWERIMENEFIPDRSKEVAARCLYTVNQIVEGNRLYESHIFLTVRAKTGTELTKAEKIVYDYLSKIKAMFLPIKTNIKDVMEYALLMSDRRSDLIKNFPPVITSDKVISQMLPNTGSLNDEKGIYCGVDILNNTEFLLDLGSVTRGRNIYVLAPSGVGKTVLVLNMCCSAVEQKMAVCMMDIKGNEMTSFVEATGGYVVSLRQNSVEYVNRFKLIKEDTTDDDALFYYKTSIAFAKQQMVTLINLPTQNYITELDEYLDEFLNSVYISLGVLGSNRNTWESTLHLTPFIIYDMLVKYSTPEIIKKYNHVASHTLSSLRMYMTKEGSKSYIFTKEFEYSKILNSPTLSFDFGLLAEGNVSADPVLFELRFNYMRQLNADYVTYKYNKGIKVFKVLEESQVVSDNVLKGYVEEVTLRRAQGQTTVLLGNSITALTANPISRPLIENMKGIFIGALGAEAREEAIKQFDLQEQEHLLRRIGSSEEYSNSFIFINRMQKNPTVPIVKVILRKGKQYKLFTPAKQKNVLAK